MSRHVLHQPETPLWLSARAAVVLVAVLVFAALAAGWAAARPATVFVDGQRVRVAAGSTVASLTEKGVVSATAGDLLSVDGAVIARRGGQAPDIERNGLPVDDGQRLYTGDRLVSRDGRDVTESVVTTEKAVPFETRFEGKGPLLEIKTLGVPGVMRVVQGERSGIEVTSTVVSAPVDEVVLRTAPRPGAKIVALTFDDGPVPGQTDKILDILKANQVPATFFALGKAVKRHPELAQRIVAEGHQLANHSFSHPAFTRIDDKAVKWQVQASGKTIYKTTGVETRWIRPPYGQTDTRVLKDLRALKTHVVMWDVDPQDWRRPGTDKIVRNVVANAKPGSIILLHDGGNDRRQTVAAVGKIIAELRARGYQFVTVQDIAAMK